MSAVKIFDILFLLTLLSATGSKVVLASQNEGDMTFFGNRWYYDKLVLPDMSDTFIGDANYKNYCKALRFHFFESAPGAQSKIVNQALREALDDFKKNQVQATGVNPTDLNKVCKIFSIGGFTHIGFSCETASNGEFSYTPSVTQLQSEQNSSGEYYMPGKHLKFLQANCYLTFAVNKPLIEIEEIADMAISTSGKSKIYNAINYKKYKDVTDAIEDPKERKNLYQFAFADLFSTLFHENRFLEEVLNFYAFPRFGAFYKLVEPKNIPKPAENTK